MREYRRINLIAMGQRIKARRSELGLTQEQLAELVEVSTSFIGHIERGEKNASVETVSRLAECLTVSIDYLVLGLKNRCDQQSCQFYKSLKTTLEAFGK